MKTRLILILFVLCLFTLTSCTKTTKTEKNMNPIVTIYLSNDKTIKCELYPEVAPITVGNFLKLVDEDFYDCTVFHRIIDNFMIQTGGYFLDGSNLYTKDAETIKGEFKSNGVENNIKHEPGVLSMARATAKDSASSQFFICTATPSHLDGDYAAFGKTIDEESLKVAIEISKVDTMNIGYGLTDFPEVPITITHIEREN